MFLTVFLPLFLLLVSCLFETRDTFRYYVKFLFYAVYSSIVAILILPTITFSPGHVKHARRASIFLRQYSKFLGIEWEFRCAEEADKVKGCVVVVNHQSILDILGLFSIWSRMGDMAAVSKKALLWVIPFGPIAWLSGTVFIDRKNGKQSMKTLVKAIDNTNRYATKLVIFPEGSRNKNIILHGIQKFKTGAFRLAIENQLPILPIVFSPYYFIDEKTKFFGHGKIIIKALPAISTEGLEITDVDELMAKVRSAMQKEFEIITKEVLTTIPADYPSNIKYHDHFLGTKLK